MKDETKKTISLKGGENQANSSKSPKPMLIFQTRNSWNSRPWLNQKALFPANLMLKDEAKKIIFKKIIKIAIKRIRIKPNRKKNQMMK